MTTDPLLAALIEAVENGGIEVALTVTVPGGLISGRCVSQRAYFMRLTAQAAGQPGADVVGIFAEGANAAASIATDFLHLIDVHLGGVVRMAGGHWRGRADTVTGWMLGAPD